MSKTNFALVTLVAAIPAAFVAYLLVMAFLSNFENMSTGLQVIVALTLLCCVVVALLPVAVLVTGSKGERAPAKTAKKEEAPAEAAAATEEADIEEADLEEEAAAPESEEDLVAAEAAEEEEDLFAAGEDEEFDYFDEEPPKR